MDTIELADGGILLYHDAFLPPDLADRYFVELRDTSAWEQKKGTFGHLQPRLTASYGDEGVTYFYSGTVNEAVPWTPTLLEIKRRIGAVRGRYNYCLLNRYCSGADTFRVAGTTGSAVYSCPDSILLRIELPLGLNWTASPSWRRAM